MRVREGGVGGRRRHDGLRPDVGALPLVSQRVRLVGRHAAGRVLLHRVEVDAEEVEGRRVRHALQREGVRRAGVQEGGRHLVRRAQQRHLLLRLRRFVLVLGRRRAVLALDPALDAGPVVGIALLLVFQPERAVVDAEHARRLTETDASEAYGLERSLEVLLGLRVAGAAALGRRRRRGFGGSLHVGARGPGRGARHAQPLRVAQLGVHVRVHDIVHVQAGLLLQRAADACVRVSRVRMLHHGPLSSWEER